MVFLCISGCLLFGSVAAGQDIQADSAADSLSGISDSLAADYLLPVDTIGPEIIPPMLMPYDSLARYFNRRLYTLDIKYADRYPRDGAEFLSDEASYFIQTYHETPLRTTVAAFGLLTPTSVQIGPNSWRPVDRVIPPDGRSDYNDLPTGDIVSVSLIEGPLSAYPSLEGGTAMLYLEPMAIPPDAAKSEFTMERGSYGYAYTRARVGRSFGDKFGFTFATDYRKGDGYDLNADDDAYQVRSHMQKGVGSRTTFDLYVNVYRREGGFPVYELKGGYDYRRARREQQYVFSTTVREFWGGQAALRLEYQSSRSAYSYSSSSVYHTLKPKYGSFELSYLRPLSNGWYEWKASAGKEKGDLDYLYYSRAFGYVSFSTMTERLGGQLFFYARVKKAEREDLAGEGAVGLNRNLSDKWRTVSSVGFSHRWPTPIDRYIPERTGAIGSGELSGLYTEKGNPNLEAEKKLTGNVTLICGTPRISTSLSLNAGIMNDLIYYDIRYDSFPAGEVFPDNDKVNFIDVNLSLRLDTLGPIFGTISATARRVDSDRYGSMPPYSPRWLLYSQAGFRLYVPKYQVRMRFFGDITYTEKPLSYKLEELETGAVITGGFNASLKDLTFYYMIHNFLNQRQEPSEAYGYSGWFYSWGFNWKFLD